MVSIKNINFTLLLIFLVMLYSIAYLNWYLSTPVGQVAVLDGAENIALAVEIYEDTGIREPFYRSMLYPFLLAFFLYLGVNSSLLHLIASITGIFLHLFNTLLVFKIAAIIWKKRKESRAAAIIYGFYPVAVYFAVQPLDITTAIFFTLCFSFCLFKGIDKNNGTYTAASGVFLGLAVFTRASLLPLVLLYIICLFIYRYKAPIMLAISLFIICIGAIGLINYARSGQYRIMPWQGSFVLYSSNGRHANGKYFTQRVYIPERNFSYNPARAESEILYKKYTDQKKIEIDAFNKFWYGKLFEEIKDAPLDWLSLKLKKLYYFFNNYEQYNNKTYLFYKNASPILRFNPLGWGFLVIMCFLSLFNRKFNEPTNKLLVFALIINAFFTIAYLVSSRFRLLCLPFVIILASGVFNCKLAHLLNKKNLAVIIVIGFISFSTFFNAADTSTFASDYLLMSHASARLDDFQQQFKWADKALELQEFNPNAIRLKLVAFVNLAMSEQIYKDWQLVNSELEFLLENRHFFSDTLFILGCYAYKHLNSPQKAKKLWEKGLEQNIQPEIFYSALLLTEMIESTDEIKELASFQLIWYALVKKGVLDNQNPALYNKMQKLEKFLLMPEN